MSQPIPFDFKGESVRGLTIDGEPWLVASDVTARLGYAHAPSALRAHVDEEDRNTVSLRDGTRGNPNVTVINESGVYSLIFGSALDSAKEFKRWVTKEVLPAIRQEGAYSAAPRDDLSMLRGMIDAIEADRTRVAALERQQQEIEARTSALEENHDRVTAIGWANIRKARNDVAFLNQLGRRASQIAKRDDVPVSRAHSTVWGQVNAWPLEIWDEAFESLA